MSEKITTSSQDKEARTSPGATVGKSQDTKRVTEEEKGWMCKARHRVGVREAAEGDRGEQKE